MNNYLEQIRTYIDAHPIKAERCLNLSEIKSGQLHHIKNNNPELADVFYLILGKYGDHYRVVPGSLDGLMGGDNDIILSEDVMGDYTFISLDLVKILPEHAIGSGFAILDNETMKYETDDDFVSSTETIPPFLDSPISNLILNLSNRSVVPQT